MGVPIYPRKEITKMYMDKRNRNKVSIIKETKSMYLVKDIKTNKRYLLSKSDIKEIK